MANPPIGHTPCPICGLQAEVRMATGKAPKPYIACEDCGFQGFARGQAAVRLLNSKTKPIAPPTPEPAPAPTPEPKLEPKPEPKKKSFWEEMGL